MSRPVAATVLLVLALLAPGCARWSERGTMPTLAIMLRDGPPAESFERLVGAARSAGYFIEFVEPTYGVMGARSHAQLPQRGGPATFVVQCYTDGRATLTVLGAAQVDGQRVRVPDALRREAVAFAQALEASQ